MISQEGDDHQLPATDDQLGDDHQLPAADDQLGDDCQYKSPCVCATAEKDYEKQFLSANKWDFESPIERKSQTIYVAIKI